ncbi:MAG: hypothetical protein J7L98_05100 [Candidatus Verstraetearchaeota archaeon]|nr:hypothetical protein [Candidatus Verstraetearchaeota archaeon]
MNSRRLVDIVFDNYLPPRPPLHVESDDKREEYKYGDIVGAGVRIADWRDFYTIGGPFKRRAKEDVLDWAERIDIESYVWPNPYREALRATTAFKERVAPYTRDRFIVFKVLGPTETSEAFFAPGVSKGEEVAHCLDFALFLKLNKVKAIKLYNRVAQIILEVVKAGAELDEVDAVRIADDVAEYTGLLYYKWFVEEHYLPWHRKLANAIKKRGKRAILHCDGNIMVIGLLSKLSEIYDGLHPLDLYPRHTLQDAEEWMKRVLQARAQCGWHLVYFTGIPLELLFSMEVKPLRLKRFVSKFLQLHGLRKLVLATTHSPYPGRSYKEPAVKRRLRGIVEMVKPS